MAFPTTIGGGLTYLAAASQGRSRPYISSAGNVYLVFLTGTSNGVKVYKATDPTDTFGLGVDTATLAGGRTGLGLCTFQDGDDIHIATQNDSDDIYYHVFSMVNDQFDLNNEAVTSAAGTDVDADKAISISLETDGSIIIFYQGASDNDMGQKERVDRAYKPFGGSWTVDQAVDDGGKVHFFLGGIVRGEADKFHLTYLSMESGSEGLKHKSVQDVDGTLSSAESGVLTTSIASQFTAIQPVYYDDAGVERITIFLQDVANKMRNNEVDDDGSPSTVENTTEENIWITGEFSVCSAAVDQKRVWVIHSVNVISAGEDQDVFTNSNDDSAGKDANDTEELDAVTCNLITSNIYQRGSDVVLAYVYDDAATIKYNEKILRSVELAPGEFAFKPGRYRVFPD